MDKQNAFFKLGVSEIKLKISTKIYPVEAVLNAAYFFIEDFYIFAAPDGTAALSIELKAKRKLAKGKLEAAAGEYFNALTAETLRLSINEANQKFRETLLEQAIASALSPAKQEPPGPGGPSPSAREELELELDEELKLIIERTKKASYKDDPLGICVPYGGEATPAAKSKKKAPKKAKSKRRG